MTEIQPTRVLVLGAHPDDAEYHAGALLNRHAALGATIRLVSVTDGRSGHQSIPSDELVLLRRKEAASAGQVIGAEYHTWDFPDGSLTPSLEVRQRIIAEIRSFKPDLVLTHRTVDYHPDHRAVGQAVQDASYMVRVPKVVPAIPALDKDPVVAYMNDPFTRPCPLRADIVIDGSRELDGVVAMMSCHASQFFDWMPWIDRSPAPIGLDESQRQIWLQEWLLKATRYRQRFWSAAWGECPKLVEAFEVSEYAGTLEEAVRERLFPQSLV